MDTLFLLLSSAGVTAIIGGVVTAIINRRKLGAETTSIESQTTQRIIDSVNKENARLESALKSARTRIADLELASSKSDEDKWALRDQINAHLDYDQKLIDMLREHGETNIPSPPKIFLR